MTAPADARTAAEGRRRHPLYDARLERLEQLANLMPTALPTVIDDELALAIRDGIRRVERGTR